MALSICGSFGVVEGFYWNREKAYRGQYGEYTHAQRRQLLQFMAAKGLNVYTYAPKVFMAGPEQREQRSVQLLQGIDLEEWVKTFKLSKALNIDFIWGITPPKPAPIDVLKLVIAQLTQRENGDARVALLFDDTVGQGHDYDVPIQAALVKELSDAFPNKVKAYAPSFYHGEPRDLETKLQEAHRLIPREIPFVFSGRSSGCSMTLAETDFPHFEGRQIVVWDNWMASDSLETEKNFTSPPLDRDARLFDQISGYWLSLAFPLERIIPAVSSIAFLKMHKRSPATRELGDLQLEDGGIADDWATEIGCSSPLTRAILRIKLANRDAAINPHIEDIVATSDLHSLHLLFTNGLKINALIKPGKTFLQLAVDQGNYPLARFLEKRNADCSCLNWDTLRQTWIVSFPHPRVDRQLTDQYRWSIVESVDKYDLKSLQQYLNMGVSALSSNSKGRSLTQIAQWHQYADLASYLKALADFEEGR